MLKIEREGSAIKIKILGMEEEEIQRREDIGWGVMKASVCVCGVGGVGVGPKEKCFLFDCDDLPSKSK
jgi:hypothetical protein